MPKRIIRSRIAPVLIACLLAAPVAAQTAREVRGAAPVEPLQNEPSAKIVIDPPLAEPLSHGRVVIQYRTENLHIVPVFGPAAPAVSPRIGHIHVTVHDAPWVWADASGEPVVLNGLPPPPGKVLLQLPVFREVLRRSADSDCWQLPFAFSEFARDFKPLGAASALL
jgi:hypothetical protein